MAFPFQTFTPATNRDGIPKSVEAIYRRHIGGETSTAIVLPPRYGKSDVIRLSALELVQTGVAPAAIALAPWENLADQLVAEDKTRQMAERYMQGRAEQQPDIFRAGRLLALSATFHEKTRLQHLFTATVQLVNANMDIFDAWLARCAAYSPSNARPVVFIDEGHLLSSRNTWGGIAELVENYGAHIVLLTGTPYRADGFSIPGFDVKTVRVKDICRVIRTSYDEERDLVKTMAGEEAEVSLIAHVTVTLKDAWDIGALCRIEAKWIDVNVDIDGEEKKLSNLTVSETSRSLRRALTDRSTVKQAMETAILDMNERRRAGKPDSAVLVVTASDVEQEGSDGDANFHARRVRDAVREIDPSLSITIATQADDVSEGKQKKGAANLARFVGNDERPGIGDVLIVKNMGTVGLDCGRIKTVVLLGTTRQRATWEQTILRGATVWGDVKYFTLVLTDDILNRTNWEDVVANQGGAMTASELHLLKEELVDKKDEPDTQGPDITIQGAEHTHTQDSHNRGEVADETEIHKVIAKFPILRERMSVIEIEQLIRSGALDLSDIQSVKSTMGVVDTGKVCAKLRSEINATVDEIVSKTIRYSADSQSAWVSARTQVFYAARTFAGSRKELRKETDEEKLRVMLEFLKQRKAA